MSTICVSLIANDYYSHLIKVRLTGWLILWLGGFVDAQLIYKQILRESLIIVITLFEFRLEIRIFMYFEITFNYVNITLFTLINYMYYSSLLLEII